MNKKMLTKTHIDLFCNTLNAIAGELRHSNDLFNDLSGLFLQAQEMITELEKENEELKKIISDRTRRQHHE